MKTEIQKKKLIQRAIEDPIRKEMMRLLPCDVNYIMSKMSLERNVVRHHLRILELSGVIQESSMEACQ